MFKRPVLLSLLAALAVALPLQSMLASLAPAASPRPGKKANQAKGSPREDKNHVDAPYHRNQHLRAGR